MFQRRLIYFSAHQVTVFAQQGGTLYREGDFGTTSSGTQQFAAYLAAHAKCVFSILANASEESFQIETIPFLRGDDRRAVIARKFGQLFFNTALTTSISLGHQKSRRKDERIMLAALTNNDAFQPWLNAIAAAEAPLAGLYSLPLLGPLLLKKIGLADERCLLLTIQDQSIRQSYLVKGELQFSRLTPLHNSSIGGMAQTFSTEAFKLQQYLVSQRIIGRQEPITAYLLAHPNARKAIEVSCEDSETLSFTILDILDCAQRCGLKTLPIDTRCELLFLHLMATASPTAQFASDQYRHGYHLWLIRSLLQGAGALFLFSCLLLSGKLAVDVYQINQETAAVGGEAALARQRYDTIRQAFPSVPTSNDSLRRIVKRFNEFAKVSVTPDYLYGEISRALQSATTIEIDGIEWKLTGLDMSASSSPQQIPGSGPAHEETENAVFHGTLQLGPGSNPRQVLSVFNGMIDALRLNSKLRVEVLQQPFDVESGKSLRGGDVVLEEKQAHTFRVQVSRTIDG